MRFLLVLFLACLSLVFSPLKAQELLCTVNIDANRIQSDRSVFEDMRQNISNYMNFNKWTEDQFEPHERIRCNLQIVVRERPSANYFVCEANIQVFRPVYNSTYETVLVNLRDASFNFPYVAFQNLQFVQNTYNDNLTALLNFYAYVILGFDYASFSPNGGMPFFKQAQEQVNLASNARESGWKSADGNRNRFWLIENLTNASYRNFHQVFFTYHRKGLDQLVENDQQSRKNISDALRQLQALNRQNPLLWLTKIMLDAKQTELVKIFQDALINEKKVFVDIMQDIDPSNIAEYNRVMEGGN